MSYRFDNSADYLAVNTSLPLITSWSFLMRFRITSFVAAYDSILKVGAASGTNTSYEINTGSSGSFLNAWQGSSGGGSTPLTAGVWYDLGVTCAGTGAAQFLVYLNGVLNITLSGSGTAVMAEIVLGRWNIAGATQRLDGCVQDVLVYNRPLNAREVYAQTKQNDPIEQAGLIHWVPCRSISIPGINYAGVNNTWLVGGTLTEESGLFLPSVVNRKKRVYFVLNGVLYTETIAGVVAPIGTTVRQVNKVLLGVVTPVGAIVKGVEKVLSGVITPIADVVSAGRLSVILAGIMTPVGVVGKQVNRAFGGVVTPIGNVVKSAVKVLNGGVNVSGIVGKVVGKVVGGTVSASGGISVGAVWTVIVGGVISLAGAIESTFILAAGPILRGLAVLWRRRRR
jgi:hypothetical protein